MLGGFGSGVVGLSKSARNTLWLSLASAIPLLCFVKLFQPTMLHEFLRGADVGSIQLGCEYKPTRNQQYPVRAYGTLFEPLPNAWTSLPRSCDPMQTIRSRMWRDQADGEGWLLDTQVVLGSATCFDKTLHQEVSVGRSAYQPLKGFHRDREFDSPLVPTPPSSRAGPRPKCRLA